MSATLTKNISRALTAERFVSSKKKQALISIGNMLVLGFAALVLASYRVQELEALRLRLLGAFLMIASLLLILYLLEAYFRSLEMHAVEECAGGKYSFEALCVLHSDSTHPLRATFQRLRVSARLNQRRRVLWTLNTRRLVRRGVSRWGVLPPRSLTHTRRLHRYSPSMQ